jgi:hypothetical protein
MREDRHRKLDSPVRAVELENHLYEPSAPEMTWSMFST